MDPYRNSNSRTSDDDSEGFLNYNLLGNFRSLNPSSGTPFFASDTPFSSSGTPFPSHSTQPSPPPPRRPSSFPFKTEEDSMLCQAWVATSIDPIHGNDQASDTFWSRIFMYYSQWLEGVPVRRDPRSLQNRFNIIKRGVSQYCGCLAQVEHRHASGTNDQDKIDEADHLYEELYNKKFNLRHCWLILRHEQKWVDRLGSSSDGRGKGMWSGDSSPGSAASPIDLNAAADMAAAFNERPMGTHTAKKKAKAKAKENTEEGFSFRKAMDEIEERREISRKRHEQEKKERFERKMRATEETLELNRMEWEHKILSMDLRGMEPAKANYYRKRQEQILRAFED